MSEVIEVRNMITEEVSTYVGISPERAVVCAHEQSKKNYNTWDYDFSKAKRVGNKAYCGRFYSIVED